MVRTLRGAGPGAVKVFVDPGIRIQLNAFQSVAHHAPANDHADPAAGAKQGIQIVRDHDNRELQL
jgi:hypothetical protein